LSSGGNQGSGNRVAKQLRPQDRVLIVSFNDEVLLLTEVTNDLNIIETVIEGE